MGVAAALRIAPLAFLAVPLGHLQAPEGLTPNAENFARWRDYLRPKSEELAFCDIPWRPTLWDAVLEAQRQDKPILLWAMNGHPLACT